MQLMALGANSPGLWQSQLAAVAARQLTSQQNNTPESRGPTPGAVGPQLPLPPNLPPPPSPLAVATSAAAPTQSPQISPNEITAIQNALQHQQQNIQQHLQNLLLLQQSANSLGNIAAAANNNVPPTPFMKSGITRVVGKACGLWWQRR